MQKALDLCRVAWLTRPDLDECLNLGRFVWLARPGPDLGLSPTVEKRLWRWSPAGFLPSDKPGTETAFRLHHCMHFLKSKHL